MTDDDFVPVEVARVLVTRLHDGSYEFHAEAAGWLSLFDPIDIAGVLHPAADQLKAEAEAYGPPPPEDGSSARIVKLVPGGHD